CDLLLPRQTGYATPPHPDRLWWIARDLNSAALLLAREMTTPSSPATHIKLWGDVLDLTRNLLVHSQALSPVELTPPKQKRWSRERGLNSRSPLYKRGILPAELPRLTLNNS